MRRARTHCHRRCRGGLDVEERRSTAADEFEAPTFVNALSLQLNSEVELLKVTLLDPVV